MRSHPSAFGIPPIRGEKGWLQDKMQEYINNGLPLGWLINPQEAQVEIYRSQKAVEVISMPAIISGENILPGFELQV